MNTEPVLYDVIVVGAGHAGCEAANAAARIGCRTLLLTIDLDKLAHMSCNPSIGGPAKGHLVREIDAMGGLMARVTDRTAIQIRLLNESKGPAVQALRAQCDKRLYAKVMKETIEAVPNLDLKQAMVERIVPPDRTKNKEQRTSNDKDALFSVLGSLFSVMTHTGRTYQGRALVLTTGTFLRGRAITGEAIWGAGRAGEAPAIALGQDLAALGFPLVRLKTGTPPRIDARTIDFAQTEGQKAMLPWPLAPGPWPLRILARPRRSTRTPGSTAGARSCRATWSTPHRRSTRSSARTSTARRCSAV